MFLPSLIVGLAATVVAFLKNRWRNGFIALGIGAGMVGLLVARGDASAGDISTGTILLSDIGFPLYAIASFLLALPAARPHSFWDRRKATVADGTLLLEQQSPASRFGRSVLGAFLGASPAVVFTLIVAAWVETGDEAQLGFIAIPFAVIGVVFGAWAGYHWLPRQDQDEPSYEVLH
ncbi:MAG: hypothetical protein OEM97_03615 [Acidimicrobiia bacterium]|nr:hypothetical protein [Acidimicrobiia bacterium]